MRVLVTGGRDWTNANAIAAVFAVLRAGFHTEDEVTLVHGAASGADHLAAQCAARMGWRVEPHPADWSHDGDAAGPIRNSRMIELGADICIAFPGPRSVGTWDCIRKAVAAGIPVRIYPAVKK